MQKMQNDPSSSRLITEKRKVSEAEAPGVGTSVRGKRSKTSKNHPKTIKPSAARGNFESDDSKWPDYFKEVSI